MGGELDPDPSTIYEVTFKTLENGTISSVDPIETSEDGTIESLPTAIPDEGYYFKGWQDQDGNPVTVGDKITSDTELTAIFKKNPGYTITFKTPENGTLSSLVPITTDNLGNIQNLPTATPNSGYEFKGYRDSEGNNISNESKIDKDTELTAIFELVPVQGTLSLSKIKQALNSSTPTSLEIGTGNKGSVQPNPIDVSEAQNGSVLFSIDNNTAYVYGSSVDDILAPSDLYNILGNNKTLQTVTVGEHFKNVESLSYTFRDAPALKTLDLSKMDISKLTDVSGLAYQCYELENIKLWDGRAKVIDVSHLAYYCKKLKTFDCSKLNTSSVKNFNAMFDHCEDLVPQNLGSLSVSNAEKMAYMFRGCSSITNVDDIAGWTPSKCKNFNEMFRECTNITNLYLSWWNPTSVESMDYMFSKMSKLTTIDIRRFNTTTSTTMGYTFDSPNLKHLTIGPGYKWNPNQRDLHGLTGTWTCGTYKHTFSYTNYALPYIDQAVTWDKK